MTGGLLGVALGFNRGDADTETGLAVTAGNEGVADGGGVGGITGRASPPFGTTGLDDVGVARVGADCGGATPLPLAGAAVGCA